MSASVVHAHTRLTWKGHDLAAISPERHITKDIELQQYEFKSSWLPSIDSYVSDVHWHSTSTLNILLIDVNTTSLVNQVNSDSRRTHFRTKSNQSLDCQMSKKGRWKM